MPVWMWILFAIVLGAVVLGFWWSDRRLSPSDRERLADESGKGGGWLV